MKWQYYVTEFNSSWGGVIASETSLNQLLNELGNLGWELVEMQPKAGALNIWVLTFKQPKKVKI